DLGWFPFELPAGARLVVSAGPGRCLDVLRKELPADHVVEVPALAADQQTGLVDRHLAVRRKKLTAEQRADLLDTTRRPDTGLPRPCWWPWRSCACSATTRRWASASAGCRPRWPSCSSRCSSAWNRTTAAS